MKEAIFYVENQASSVKFQYCTNLWVGAMLFRSYKNNLLLADIDISSCNFQFYFLQVAKCKLKRVAL